MLLDSGGVSVMLCSGGSIGRLDIIDKISNIDDGSVEVRSVTGSSGAWSTGPHVGHPMTGNQPQPRRRRRRCRSIHQEAVRQVGVPHSRVREVGTCLCG